MKSLKRLQDEWYRRLAEDGFDDIETRNGEVKRRSGFYSQRGGSSRDCSVDYIRETSDYFHSAEQLLHEYRFGRARDRRIWELHCRGLSTRQIERELGHVDHCTVYQVVKKVRAVFLEVKNVASVSAIKIRDGALGDTAFIYSTWLRPLYYDNDEIGEIRKEKFMKAMQVRVTQLLEYPSVKVRIACLQDAPDVIVGYSVVEWRRLWWVYVKKAWREMGIAKKLVPGNIVSCAYLTRLGKMLKPDSWEVDPYLTEEVQ